MTIACNYRITGYEPWKFESICNMNLSCVMGTRELLRERRPGKMSLRQNMYCPVSCENEYVSLCTLSLSFALDCINVHQQIVIYQLSYLAFCVITSIGVMALFLLSSTIMSSFHSSGSVCFQLPSWLFVFIGT